MELPHEYTCKQWCSACTLFANEWAASVNHHVMLMWCGHIFWYKLFMQPLQTTDNSSSFSEAVVGSPWDVTTDSSNCYNVIITGCESDRTTRSIREAVKIQHDCQGITSTNKEPTSSTTSITYCFCSEISLRAEALWEMSRQKPKVVVIIIIIIVTVII